jgi:hypothetical protein
MQSPEAGNHAILWFRCEKVVLYGAQQTDVALPAAVFCLVSHALHRVF